MRNVLVITAVLAVLVSGCGGDGTADQAAAPDAEVPAMQFPGEPVSGGLQTTASGLQYYVLESGSGDQATAGQQVSVQYTGYLLSDGSKFDSSVDRGVPFDFTLGVGAVIPGWDEGVALMKVGGKHKLIIPPDLAYGAEGAPGVIPPDATLVFDVELLGVE